MSIKYLNRLNVVNLKLNKMKCLTYTKGYKFRIENNQLYFPT